MNISKAFERLHLSDDLFVWDHYDGSSALDFEELYLGHLKTYNKFYHEKKEIWYIPAIMSGSDYSGDTVTRSNFLEMKSYVKRSKYVKEMYGGHGSYGIAFNVSKLKGKFAQELVDIFKQLENYPLIDDEAMSNLEMELEAEDWTNNGASEFASHLKKALEKIGIVVDEIRDSNPNVENDPSKIGYDLPQSLWDIYRELMEKTNTYPTFETGCLVYIDYDRLFEEHDKLVEVIGKKEVLEWLLEFEEPDLDEVIARLHHPNVTYPITLQALIEKWGDLAEIDKRLTLYDDLYEEWCLNALSFDDKEALATITGEAGSIGKYYYLYSVLKEMEK